MLRFLPLPAAALLAAQAFRLNLAIGGPQGGDPSPTPFPQRHQAGHLRIYRNKK